jgi:tetratricopeptide (TPR) repeat protein
MAEPVLSPSSRIRLRPAIIVAVVLALLWLTAYWHLHQLSWNLVQVSRPGARALVLYLAGNYRDAARAYRAGQQGRLEAQYAEDPTGYWALRAGDLDESERRAKTTLALVPTAVEPQITLGELALERGQRTEAVRIFADVLRRNADHVDARYLYAVAMAYAGDPESAIQSLNRALRANSSGERDTIPYRIMELTGELRARPSGQQPLCLLAHLHRYLRIFDQRQGLTAMDYARRAIQAGDRPADAYLTLGVVHYKRGEYEAARRAMRQAIAADPRHAEALSWLAGEAGTVGDTLLQYQMVTRAFEAAPTDPFYLPGLERVLVAKLGDPLGMATLMERAIALDATNAEAHAQLKKALTLLGDHDGARRQSERLAALQTGRGEKR